MERGPVGIVLVGRCRPLVRAAAISTEGGSVSGANARGIALGARSYIASAWSKIINNTILLKLVKRVALAFAG
jgi:hypothetical protein